MKKIIIFLLSVFVAGWQLNAQNTNPGCGDTFYDDGGPNNDYSNNLSQTITITPDNSGDVVTVTFNSFDMEESYDGMMVYNGPDTTYPIFDSGSTYSRTTCPDGAWTGGPGDTYSADGHSFTSTDSSGALTFVFTTDGSVAHAGWEAVVTCAPPPTCPAPTDLAASNITNNSADLSWTENGSASTWNIEYGPTGFTQGQGTTISVTSNPYTLTGLTASSSYDFYVQSDCGGGDLSSWVGPFNFHTTCDVITTFPYDYGFEDMTANSEADWSQSCWSGNPENATGASNFDPPFRWTPIDGPTPSSSTGPAGPHSGSMYAYTEASGSSDGDVAELISPVFDLSSLTVPELTFYYFMYGTAIGILSVDTYDGTTWTNDVWTLSGQQQTSDSDPWVEATVYFSNNVTQIRFRAVRGAGYTSDFAIDDISIHEAPSCPHPTSLAVSNVGPNSADLSWQENGSATTWNIEYGPAGFTQGQGTTVSTTNNPYTLNGLTAATSYDFYVQSDCGGDLSTWEGPFNFRTTCDIITSFPYNYGFEDVSANTEADWTQSCWSANPENINGIGSTDPPYRWNPTDSATPSSNTGPAGPRSGSIYAYTEASGSSAGDVAELTSPIFDLSSLTAPQLTFYYFMYGSDIGSLSVDTYDGTTWTNDVWAMSGEQQTSDSDPWLEANVYFANNVTQIRFRAIRGSGFHGDIAIDDIVIGEAPTCPHPSSLTVSNVTSDSADLSWTENGSATTWNIEYGPAGFTQGQGTTISVTSNPYTLTGLSSATSYDFYVQSDCGGGDLSTWEGPFTFMTAGTCGFFVVDLIDSYGDGWNGGLLTVFINGNVYLNITLDNGTGPESHYIPVNTGDILSFEYTAGSFSDENQYIVYDNNNNEVANEGDNGTPGNIGDPSIPTGLEACPSCPKPTNLSASNITTTTADLSWQENGSATTWNIEYGPAGFTQGQGTTVSVTSNPYTLTGLSSATEYDFYVQSDCGGGDLSIWEGPYSFMTPGTCGFFKVDLLDSYGDGWNGGLLTVFVNGTVFENMTLDNGAGPESHYIPVDTGDILSFDYTPGSYSDENEYVVYDNNNFMQADEGAGQTEPGDIGDPSIPTGLEACPSCPKPTNLYATNITAHEAELSWTENGTATTWNIEYGYSGFAPGQGTTISVTTNPYTLTGLDAATPYDFYVQSDCGGGDVSLWEGPYSFTTLCDPQLPYTQTFDVSMGCWTVEDTNADGKTWTRATAPSSLSCVSGNGDYVMFAKFSDTQDMNDWLFSPGFDLSAGTTYAIEFSYGNDGTSVFAEDMDVYISTAANSTDALNGTQILSETGIINGCHDFTNYNITVPSNGIYYIAFHGKSPAGQDVLMIDDFVIDTANNVNELTNVTGIYPNPTSGQFVIKSHDLGNAEVFVYTMTGKEIYHNTINSDAYTVNLTNVQKGVYFVKVMSDNKSYVSKLIIK